MIFGSRRTKVPVKPRAEADLEFIGMDRRDPMISSARSCCLTNRFEEAMKAS